MGLCGLGTVGQGLVELLDLNAEVISRQAGRPIRLVQVASRTAKPGFDLHGATFSTDIAGLIGSDEVDVVVELIGGETVALDLSRAALAAGKSLVSGNKALLAEHGEELFALAERNHVGIGLEAAVAGGIPLINALVSGLGGNQIGWVAGIINGTCNYILTAMTEDGADFDAVLATAQELGYAEADPSFDVGGIDAAHKIAIIARLVFGVPISFADVPVSGIEAVGAEDIEYARQLGYRIKHLGVAVGERDANGKLMVVDVRAHAALIPEDRLLAGVGGVTNAAMVQDNAVGLSMYSGPGAGGLPTAASVVADLIRVAQGSLPVMPSVSKPDGGVVARAAQGPGRHRSCFLPAYSRPRQTRCAGWHFESLEPARHQYRVAHSARTSGTRRTGANRCADSACFPECAEPRT